MKTKFFVIIEILLLHKINFEKFIPSEASPIHGGGEGSLKPEQCPNACDFRCSATSHKEPCIFFCNYCCKKCLCVPSGTYGNRQECPCYDKIKTKEGGPKCP
ncbi:hypothetical protein Bca52824_032407 [Brassica carinata]|uniref:Uncharacterized protein n=1 Tax=Brassica carinata TaxID=52824 RepID=A0A8X7V8M5_BRACI|nr:hypothetical protein Bca52824_032407 [Brassica carinata]